MENQRTKQNALADYQNGSSVNQIARHYNIDIKTISEWIKQDNHDKKQRQIQKASKIGNKTRKR